MLGRNFTIARFGGIAIEANPSWLLVLGLVAWTLADGAFPELYDDWSVTEYWVAGAIASLLLFATVLLHELAHAIVATRRGIEVPRITLFIFGGVSQLATNPRTAKEEFLIAGAGPLTSVIIAIVAGLAAVITDTFSDHATAVLGYLAVVNLTLGLFNMLPGFPLDGGRVFRSIVWGRTGSFPRATRIAGAVGELFGSLLMGFGLVVLLTGNALTGIWLGLIGWFLSGAARGESRGVALEQVLGGLLARDLMQTDYDTVPPWLTLQRVVDDHFLEKGLRWAIVAGEDSAEGIITISDLRKAAREDWPGIPAHRVMTPRDQITAVPATAPAMEVLRVISEKGLNQVPVLDEGRLVGVITRRELLDRVDLEQRLGSPTGEGASRTGEGGLR